MDIAPNLDNLDWVELGTRLQLARKDAKKTQADAAEVLGVSRPTLIAVEKGKRSLRATELVKLAELYGVDLHELLRERAVAADLGVLFRRRFENRLVEDPDADEIDQAVVKLQRYSENYVELEAMIEAPLPKRYPTPYPYEGLPVQEAADEIARAERARLSLGNGPLKYLRSLLEAEVGLRIFYMELPSKVAGMFGFTEELGGCIAVNSKHPQERQLNSLAHEYGHFLTERTTADVQILWSNERYSRAERFVNAFAPRFLMPEEGVRRQLRAYKQASGKDALVLGDLLRLAHYYGVSFESFGYRLEELGVLRADSVDAWKAQGLKVRKAQELVGITRDEQDRDRKTFPERYEQLAVLAYIRGELSEGQLAKFLDTHRLEARRTVDEFQQQKVFDVEGQEEGGFLSIETPVEMRGR